MSLREISGSRPVTEAVQMASPAPPITPRHVTRPRPDTPSETSPSTPNTRKRQRVDYVRLHNGPPRRVSPTPTASQPSPRRPAPIAQIQSLTPRFQSRPPSRVRHNRHAKNTTLFLPEREPTLSASSAIITVDSSPSGPQPKVSSIKKHAWWWKYFDVRLLDSSFVKGKIGKKTEEVWNERWTCNVTTTCGFYRYADKCHTSVSALKDR